MRGTSFISAIASKRFSSACGSLSLQETLLHGCCMILTFSGLQVPLSYLQLYDAVGKEAARRAATNEPPILTSDELLQVAKSNPDNDIYDVDELNQGKIFLSQMCHSFFT